MPIFPRTSPRPCAGWPAAASAAPAPPPLEPHGVGAVVVGDGAEAEAAGADENVAGADVAASLVMTPAFLLSSICFSKQGILQSELHRALQTAPCYCPFDGGVVFGPLLALFGCKSSRDRGINGGFLIFGRAAGSRCRCRLRFFDL